MPYSRAEVVIAGRSNAGKSSVINALAGRKRLAFVSKAPGRTQLINFFALGNERYLVDLPGYGYAKVPQAVKAEWEAMIAGYLESARPIKGLIVAMDIRHPLKELDVQLLRWFGGPGRRLHVLLTKSDKMSVMQAETQKRQTQGKLSALMLGISVQLFSVPRRIGIEELEAVLENWLEAGGAVTDRVE